MIESVVMRNVLLTMLFLAAMIFNIDAQTTNSPVKAEKPASADEKSTMPPATSQSQNSYTRPAAKERFKRYLNNTAGIGLIGVGFGAAIQQIAKVPPEWKQNGNGFARRLGSTFGENAIQESVVYGLEELLKLDSKFYKSRKRDFGSRLKNALLSEVTARTPSGKRVFNPAPIIGSHAANLVSTNVWYPKRYGVKDGFRQGTQSFALSIGIGFINEFLLHRR